MAKRPSKKQQTATIGSLLVALAIAILSYLANELGLLPTAPETPDTPPARATNAPSRAPTSNMPAPTFAPGASSLPDMPVKPKPQQITFKGCPPEGDGGDPEMNRLKNRVDEGNYVPVSFDAIFNLTWPKAIETKDRNRWSRADAAEIAKYEGIPVQIEGYWVMARLSGPESPNCHGEDAEYRDHHIWMVKNPNDDRPQSIVIEPTPRVKAKHPSWTTENFNRVAREKLRLRVSGWLMMDAEHPIEIGKTRGTIWEIHPIMQVEVQQQGRWVTLDDFAKR
jgi:hypothetical protein